MARGERRGVPEDGLNQEACESGRTGWRRGLPGGPVPSPGHFPRLDRSASRRITTTFATVVTTRWTVTVTWRTITVTWWTTASRTATTESLEHLPELVPIHKSIFVAIQSSEALLHTVRCFFFRKLAIFIGIRFVEPRHHLFGTEFSTISTLTRRTTTFSTWSVTFPGRSVTIGASHGPQFIGTQSTVLVTVHASQDHDGLINFI